MAKKLITAMLTLTLIACSTISIYATDTTEDINNADTETIADEILTEDEEALEESEEAEEAEEAKDAEEAEEPEDSEEADKPEKKETKVSAEKKAEAKLKNGLAAYIRKVNPTISKTKSKNMAGYFIAKGKKYNLDPKVLMGIAQNESTFYTNAKSPYGYKGLMQTSDSLARKYGYKPSSLYKANVSIEVGARYLGTMKKRFKTYTKAISAYAYGEGTVMSGNYSTALAKKILKTRDQISNYLKKNDYV